MSGCHSQTAIPLFPSLMEASSFPLPLASSCLQTTGRGFSANSNPNLLCRGGIRRGDRRNRRISLIRAPPTSTCAIDGGTVSGLAPVEITWQIAAGALAGVTPFIVAGIEFSKRIMVQRRCGTCDGSGLVLMNECYIRCPSCGGFLPWQSWKRFFSG